jgi:DNA mismatch endonuclease (patch repair protein)
MKKVNRSKYWSDQDSPVRRSMRANRSRDTVPETTLRKALWRTGSRGYRLQRRDVPGTPDLAWMALRVAVFVHGCFWHRCPNCEKKRRVGIPKSNTSYWFAKFERNAQRHLAAVRSLEADGWVVLTIWECEVKSLLGEVTARIGEILQNRRASE